MSTPLEARNRLDGTDLRDLSAEELTARGVHPDWLAALNAEQECATLSTASILTKPFDLDDLLDAVRSQLPVAT